jgi:2-isopropylmalate synthase
MNDAFKRFKDLADRKKVVYDEDIVALVDDEVVRANDRIKLVGLSVSTGMHTRPIASIALEVDGEAKEGVAGGDGGVDATFAFNRGRAVPSVYSYTLTGVNTTLTKTGARTYVVTAAAGAITVTGRDIGLTK